MSLKVTQGHLFLRYIFCVSNMILPKFDINANKTKMHFFNDIMFGLIITLTYGQLLLIVYNMLSMT